MMFFEWMNKVSENAPSHTSLNTVLLGPVRSQTQRGGEKNRPAYKQSWVSITGLEKNMKKELCQPNEDEGAGSFTQERTFLSKGARA